MLNFFAAREEFTERKCPENNGAEKRNPYRNREYGFLFSVRSHCQIPRNFLSERSERLARGCGWAALGFVRAFIIHQSAFIISPGILRLNRLEGKGQSCGGTEGQRGGG